VDLWQIVKCRASELPASLSGLFLCKWAAAVCARDFTQAKAPAAKA